MSTPEIDERVDKMLGTEQTMAELMIEADELGIAAPAGLTIDLLVKALEGKGFSANDMVSLQAVLGFLQSFIGGQVMTPAQIIKLMHEEAASMALKIEKGELVGEDLH